ncbi:MAG: transporter [Victivallales bacterium]|nr:transporter [Victivallales bacterium]
MKKLIIVLTALAVASVLFAYDPLYTEDNGVLLKHLELKAGATFDMNMVSDYFDSESEKQEMTGDMSFTGMYVPIRVGIGIMDYADLQILLPVVSNKYSNGTETSGSGIGDMWIEARGGISLEETMPMHFAFHAAVMLPTGNDEPDSGDLATGTGRTDLDFGLQFSMRPEEEIGFACDASAGYRLKMEKDDYDLGDVIPFALKAGYVPMEGLYPYAMFEGYYGIADDKLLDNDIEDSAGMLMDVGVGAEYRMESGLGFSGGFLYDVAGTNANAGLGFHVCVDYMIGLGE